MPEDSVLTVGDLSPDVEDQEEGHGHDCSGSVSDEAQVVDFVLEEVTKYSLAAHIEATVVLILVFKVLV